MGVARTIICSASLGCHFAKLQHGVLFVREKKMLIYFDLYSLTHQGHIKIDESNSLLTPPKRLYHHQQLPRLCEHGANEVVGLKKKSRAAAKKRKASLHKIASERNLKQLARNSK